MAGESLSYAASRSHQARAMNPQELLRLRAAITRDPGNAELRYPLGAELAERRGAETPVA